MKMTIFIPLSILYVIFMQLFVLANMSVSMYFQPYIYLFLLLYIEPDMPAWSQVLAGLFLGLLFDMMFNSQGVHIIAASTVGFLKPFLARIRASKVVAREKESASWLHATKPAFKHLFIISMIVVHHLLVFTLENLGHSFLFITLPTLLISSLATYILILLSDEIFFNTFNID
jgi:cell shape-determining protein MreD